MSDEQIIEEILNGNGDAFREIISRYESQVAATVIGMLGKTPEAEDVGQEVFVRFFNSLKNFRGESSVGTYLVRIAINLSLNEIKRRKRRNLFFLQSKKNEFDVVDPDSEKGYDDDKEIIRKALEKLEPKFRTVLVLRLIDGYSTEETAKILTIPVGTVLSRLARAQKKLKEILSPILEVNNG